MTNKQKNKTGDKRNTCLPSCWSVCPSCLPSCWSLCSSCLPSCWSLCPLSLFLVHLVSLLFPFVSLLVSVLVCHCVLSPFSFVLSPFLLAIVSLVFILGGHCVRLVSLQFQFVSQVCRCWCPPLSASHVAFLFICLPDLSLLVSALFRWP